MGDMRKKVTFQKIKTLSFRDPILVTRPLVPAFTVLAPRLKKILKTRCLTNQGEFVQQLEAAVADYLDVERCVVFNNGMMALYLSLLGFELSGEIITTPFTFPATVHAIQWARCTPVFGDIHPQTFTLSPESLERLITPRTTAIFPVHVFGIPCDIEGIQRVADRHGLKVIYDAAHAFGVRRKGVSIARFGDTSMYSFHATKIFNTLEGGALVSRDSRFLDRVSRMKNFGFDAAGEVASFGVNAKMNEVQAVFGLSVLDQVTQEVKARRQRCARYRQQLASVPGVGFQTIPTDVETTHQYMPILIRNDYGMSRQALCDFLSLHNVFPRKYFYPLCSNIPIYRGLKSSPAKKLPVANQISEQVLCLPLYGSLPLESIDQICELIRRAAHG
jgi:dTDP-4-amino-4,6-dideoxygalactose transaminase